MSVCVILLKRCTAPWYGGYKPFSGRCHSVARFCSRLPTGGCTKFVMLDGILGQELGWHYGQLPKVGDILPEGQVTAVDESIYLPPNDVSFVYVRRLHPVGRCSETFTADKACPWGVGTWCAVALDRP